jgi:hypothetical protein
VEAKTGDIAGRRKIVLMVHTVDRIKVRLLHVELAGIMIHNYIESVEALSDLENYF